VFIRYVSILTPHLNAEANIPFYKSRLKVALMDIPAITLFVLLTFTPIAD
ncbi:hypothetical protein L208DRAFT_1411229, partial [Tricholoma matsutake]